MGISYQTYIGRTVDQLPELPAPVEGNISLNTPVGSCVDRLGHVWLADTAHNRLVIFDQNLEHILSEFGSTGSDVGQFNMPFRLLAHPDKNWIYVTDIGNYRVHILEYDDALNIRSISCFGNEAEVGLKGPNGIVFHHNELCVADEFFEGDDGEGRLVIFSDAGEYKRSSYEISTGVDKESLKLLWPQGLSVDSQGNIYIANTGFNTVVRCDWNGQGVAFTGTKKPYIDGLELARDVSFVQGKILIPGGDANGVSVYGANGRKQGVLSGFFAPIQITEHPEEHQLLITEPILAALQLHKINLKSIQGNNSRATKVLASIGDDRDNEGQLHFVTSVVGDVTPNSSPENPVSQTDQSLENLMNYQLELQEQMFKAMQPPGMPSWMNMGVNFQAEWVQRLQQSWWRMFLGERFEDPDNLLWLVDAGNYQIQASDDGKKDSLRSASLPLLPGSLGVAALTPDNPLPGQLDYSIPLLVVSNFLSSIVTIYQYSPILGELIPYTVFGSMGNEPWQFSQPQGIAIDPTNNDILIADSGNHRIARWRLTGLGIAGLVDTFGSLGEEDTEFHTPSDVAVNMQGYCYVTDQFNHRIQVFDGQGQWQRSFGEAGYGIDNDKFLLPTSIEHENGYLIISDLVNRAIKVFDTEGQFVDSFFGFGADESKGQLWMPYLLHVRNNKVYMPDCALNRVNVYELNTSGVN
jgi:DNA-binding beta-propeller fold protein YncE